MEAPAPDADFHNACIIGSGAQGKVYKATKKSSGKQVAVKVVDVLEINGETRQSIERGIQNYMQLRHINVVEHYEHIFLDSSIFNPIPLPHCLIVMEFCCGGTLQQAIKTKMPETVLIKWISHILNGLQYLHSNKISHRDVKPLNILLDKEDKLAATLKLTDFGTMKVLMQSNTKTLDNSGMRGTDEYMSPEMVMRNPGEIKIGRRTDIWSLGCVILSMFNRGKPIYQERNSWKLLNIIVDSGPNLLKLEDQLSEPMMMVVKRCLEKHPKMRPSASDLLKEPIFREINQLIGQPDVDESPPVPTFNSKVIELSRASTFVHFSLGQNRSSNSGINNDKIKSVPRQQ